MRAHEFIFGDIRSETIREQILSGASTVVHLANRGFSASTPPSEAQLAIERSTTLKLAEDAVRAGVSRFIVLSSIHVYGRTLVGNVYDDTPADPVSTLGISRLRIEEDLMALAESTSMNVTIIRMSNSFGTPAVPRPETWGLLLHDLCKQAVQSHSLTLRSDPRISRDMMALRDVVDVLQQVINSKRVSSGIYLLASGQTNQLIELAQLVRTEALAQLGKDLSIETSDFATISPASFTLSPIKLREAGVMIPQNREEEIRDLLRYAVQEFHEATS
jgi:UDP-glucose 4-epimerase